MSDVFAKNQATTAADAAKIAPRAEFRVFGHGIIDRVKERMWNGKTVLYQARRMPAETYFLSAATDDSILNRVTAQIEALAPAPTPGHVLVRLNAGGAPLLARVTQRSARALNLAPGMTVFAQIKAVALLD